MIISVREFDHAEKRVLCHTREDGQDRIEWIEMRKVYVNENEERENERYGSSIR